MTNTITAGLREGTPVSSKRACIASYLGLQPYERTLQLQQKLMRARIEGKVPDALLLLQHPPVFTVGRFRGREDIIVAEDTLAREGVSIIRTDRGGSVTCHCPGQLVGYPVIHLRENRIFVKEYIEKLEEVIIKLLLSLGIAGHWEEKHPGVWVAQKKVCSIGIHVSHGVTTHGFALNINNDLKYFQYIKPCGFDSGIITSISKLTGYSLSVESILDNLVNHFSEVFNVNCEWRNEQWLVTSDAPNG